jgi:F-type H+-transporting ATPase subunit b
MIATLLAVDPAKSLHPIWPAMGELIYGSLASILVFSLIAKFAGPSVKKYYAERSANIGKELEGAAAARSAAETDAAEIRRALGDLDAERARLLDGARGQATTVLSEGRARLTEEIAELEARAEADIALAASRGSDELRGEITQLAAVVTERLLAETLDDSAQQALVEDFIARVGASS